MKKVKMIVTNRYDPDVRVHKEAKYLVSKGCDVEILCWDRENEYTEKKSEKIDGVRVRRFFPYSQYGSGIKQVGAFYKFVIEVKKYLSKTEYQYLHCHDLDGIISGFFSNVNKRQLIFDMHEYYEIQKKNKKIRPLIKIIVDYLQTKSNHIIYVNEIQINSVNKFNQNKLQYLPNYPEKDSYMEISKEASQKLRIAYIGVVRQYTELKNLMDACKEIDGVEISVHGGGVAFQSLKKIESEYNNVEISGVFPYSSIGELYSKADILYVVYSSSNEQHMKSYPVKFFEAIITKTPVIVNKGSVLEEFLNEHNIGFVINSDNVQDIKRLINSIVNNRSILIDKRNSLAAIQYNYSWEKVVKNLDKIYKT